MKPESDGHLSSLNKALDVLESFSVDQPEWGGRVAYVRDPSGNQFGVFCPPAA